MLLYFILGIIFISIGIPLFEGISSFIQSFFEVTVYKQAFKVYKLKKEMGLIEENQDQSSNPIGFTCAIGQQIQNLNQEEYEQGDE